MPSTSRVRIEVSARHCHVTPRDVAILFGRNQRLHQRRKISQPGQFAASEVVRIKIGAGEIVARIVGPERPKTQVEISLTEAKKFGVNPPVTYFGDLRQPRGLCTLIGPKGRIRRRAVIVAERHIHIDPVTARRLRLRNRQVVSVRTHGRRPTTFHHVAVRINPKFLFRCHVDTDEANAAGIKTGGWGTIIKGDR